MTARPLAAGLFTLLLVAALVSPPRDPALRPSSQANSDAPLAGAFASGQSAVTAGAPEAVGKSVGVRTGGLCPPGDTGQQTSARSQVSAGVDERPGVDKSLCPSREVPSVIGVTVAGAPLPHGGRRTDRGGGVEAAGTVTVAPEPAGRPVRPRMPLRASVRPVATSGGLVRGVASWFDIGPGFYAAMPGFRDGTRVVAVVTSVHDGRAFSVTVVIRTQCQCYVGTANERLIDLGPDAFRELGWPLSRGIAPVQVTVIEGSLR